MNKSLMFLGLFVIAIPALAEPPALLGQGAAGLSDSTEAIVEAKLLAPLHKKEQDRSRFSRAAIPPSTRRVRILDPHPQSDAQGRKFFRFAIDESRLSFRIKDQKQNTETNWSQNTITGCVYPKTREVSVVRGQDSYDASVLWGAKTEKLADYTCRPLKVSSKSL